MSSPPTAGSVLIVLSFSVGAAGSGGGPEGRRPVRSKRVRHREADLGRLDSGSDGVFRGASRDWHAARRFFERGVVKQEQLHGRPRFERNSIPDSCGPQVRQDGSSNPGCHRSFTRLDGRGERHQFAHCEVPGDHGCVVDPRVAAVVRVGGVSAPRPVGQPYEHPALVRARARNAAAHAVSTPRGRHRAAISEVSLLMSGLQF